MAHEKKKFSTNALIASKMLGRLQVDLIHKAQRELTAYDETRYISVIAIIEGKYLTRPLTVQLSVFEIRELSRRKNDDRSRNGIAILCRKMFVICKMRDKTGFSM